MEQDNLTIEEVFVAVGYHDASSLRRALRKYPNRREDEFH